jgi:predicted  nucleic acid-binding Zn-ribbon protein
VPIKRNACGGCNSRIIPQKRVEIYKENKIFVCDVCNRFLYSEKAIDDEHK